MPDLHGLDLLIDRLLNPAALVAIFAGVPGTIGALLAWRANQKVDAAKAEVAKKIDANTAVTIEKADEIQTQAHEAVVKAHEAVVTAIVATESVGDQLGKLATKTDGMNEQLCQKSHDVGFHKGVATANEMIEHRVSKSEAGIEELKVGHTELKADYVEIKGLMTEILRIVKGTGT